MSETGPGVEVDARDSGASSGPRTSLEVYETVRDAILSGTMPRDARITETGLARELGIGRDAVRIALVRLDQDGLVELLPNRGARVRTPTDAELAEIVMFNGAVEGLAARASAKSATPDDIERLRARAARMEVLVQETDFPGLMRADNEFHRDIMALSGMQTPLRMTSGRNAHRSSRLMQLLTLSAGSVRLATAEHHEIVDALAHGDPDEAERAVRRHYFRNAEVLRSVVGASGGG